jgi:hypothetical protein
MPICGNRGWAGPTCCILRRGHNGPHEYGDPPTLQERHDELRHAAERALCHIIQIRLAEPDSARFVRLQIGLLGDELDLVDALDLDRESLREWIRRETQ